MLTFDSNSVFCTEKFVLSTSSWNFIVSTSLARRAISSYRVKDWAYRATSRHLLKALFFSRNSLYLAFRRVSISTIACLFPVVICDCLWSVSTSTTL